MAKETIISQLKDIISNYVELNGRLNENLSLAGDMGLDSFGLLQMVCSIEDNFHIHIPECEIKNFLTLSDIVSFIQQSVA